MKLLIFSSLLLLVGCQHVSPRQPTGLTASAFWKDQQNRLAETGRLAGKIAVRLQGKKDRISGRGRLLAVMPDQIRLELRDPLGRMQYALSLHGKDAVAYYPSQKLAYLDSRSGFEYLKRFLGLELTLAELEQVFVGVLPGARKSELTGWEWDREKGYYRATLPPEPNSDNVRKITIFVDGRTAALAELEVETKHETLRIVYTDPEPCCDRRAKLGEGTAVAVGQTVSIHLENARASVEVEWENITKLAKDVKPEPITGLADEVRKVVLE
jgi:outer membrane biogenesis lipoprotein LolB